MTELAEHSIASWRSMPPSMSHVRYPAEMKYISPECSLYDAIQALQVHRFHRLPVLDPQQHSVLTIASHRGVLEFLVSSLREQRRLYDQSIKDLGIGTFHELITVPENMPLIRVLYVLVEKKISSVPIVNVNGAVTNIYSISDVTVRVCISTVYFWTCLTTHICIYVVGTGQGSVVRIIRHSHWRIP